MTENESGHDLHKIQTSTQKPIRKEWSSDEKTSAAPKRINKRIVVGGVIAGFALLLLAAQALKQGSDGIDDSSLDTLNAPFLTARSQEALSKEGQDTASLCQPAFEPGIAMQRTPDGDEFHPMRIRNGHDFELAALIYRAETKVREAIVHVAPGDTGEILLNPGAYTLEALTGTGWCNHELGFKSGAHIVLAGKVDLDGADVPTIEFVKQGKRPRDVKPRLFFGDTPQAESRPVAKRASPGKTRPNGDPTQEATPTSENAARISHALQARLESDGSSDQSPTQDGNQQSNRNPGCRADNEPIHASSESLILRPFPGGNYFVQGAVNKYPVVFLVEPSFGYVTLPQNAAARAGIQSCSQQKIQTASGTMQGCMATIAELKFGDFRVRNVEVVVLKDAAGDAVLGRNVLQRFRVQQANKVMEIGHLK